MGCNCDSLPCSRCLTHTCLYLCLHTYRQILYRLLLLSQRFVDDKNSLQVAFKPTRKSIFLQKRYIVLMLIKVKAVCKSLKKQSPSPSYTNLDMCSGSRSCGGDRPSGPSVRCQITGRVDNVVHDTAAQASCLSLIGQC
jgi:hypothetical protein